MHYEATAAPLPQRRKKSARAMAGKALVVFLILMVVLTLASRTLQEMTLARVQTTRPQRGALEHQVKGEGTLSAATTVPVVVPDSVRVLDVPVQAGAQIAQGDPLLMLDYAALIKEKTEAYEKAAQDLDSKQQAYDWAYADVNGTTLERMEKRQEELEKATASLQDASTLLQERQLEQDTAQDALDVAQNTGDEAQITPAQRTLRRAQNATAEAQRAFDKAQKALDDAQQDVDAFSKVRDYITKGEELETSRTALAKARTELADLLAVLDEPLIPADGSLPAYEASGNYQRTILSPVDGSVQKVQAVAGAMLSTNDPAMTLDSLSGGLALSITVEADQAAEMKVGDPANIVVDGKVYEVPISAIAPATDASGKYTLRFDLPGKAGSAGMSGSMYFSKRTQQYDALVPLSALRKDNSGDFVYVVQQQDSALGTSYTLKRVNVTVLEKDATRAAIQGGVSTGDLLVTRGDRELADGNSVRLEES